MPYTPDPTNGAQPLDTEKAATAAAEFRALKTYIQATLPKKTAINQFTEPQEIVKNTAIQLLTIQNPKAGNAVNSLFGIGNGTDADIVFKISELGAASKSAVIGPTVNIPLFLQVANANKWGVAIDNTLYPVTTGHNLGYSSNRIGFVYATQADFIGTVTAASFTGILNGNVNGNVAGTLTGSVNGNAATATKASTLAHAGNLANNGMIFNWSGQAGMPPWVWGGVDGINHYVYNPANFQVAFATSAGSASVATAVGQSLSAGAGISASGPYNGSVARTFSISSGSNGFGSRTVSAAAPSGGVDGDIWYQT